MTAIRVKCPSCGDVNLAPHEMSLQLHPSGDRGAYRFTCPECNSQVDRPASRKVTALLISAGVGPVPTDEEAESLAPVLPLEDRCPDPSAAPFTLDDLIAFHFLLEDDVAIAEVFALEP
jgi:predicted RNA-binding Zn-ribbon protein involved in translation (DUF1610 family)